MITNAAIRATRRHAGHQRHDNCARATIRAAVIAALKDADYLHISAGRRGHSTPAETLRMHGLD